jgi:hypothetical protein
MISLDGKEIEGDIGKYGKYFVDLKPDGKIEIAVLLGTTVDIIAEVEKLAAKTNTKIDDNIAKFLKALVGRE